MTTDATHIFEKLRNGLVPEHGLEAFAVGIEAERAEVQRQLDLAAGGEGAIKFLRGGYGCGKTFLARLSLLDAQDQGFATSFVVVSDNDLRFYRFEEVYRRVVSELSTQTCARGALGDVLDRWIATVEDKLIELGEDEDADDFDDKVRRKISEELASMTENEAPPDFVRAVQTIFELKQEGKFAEAGALLSWLSGSANVAASAKKRAQIKGDIGSQDALQYLRGVLAIVKAAGYRGMVIVIDEAETILRSRSDSRQKSLNGLRQICDASGGYPGLLWILTGTPEFFDTKRGVAGLPPLHDRIRFLGQGGLVNLRQPQLQLRPFDSARLRNVAVQLRELFPAKDRARLMSQISDEFLGRLVDQVTEGFKGDVGVVPRQFLRELVHQMDLVDQHSTYEPMKAYAFQPEDLSLAEREALRDTPEAGEDAGDEADAEDPGASHTEVW